MTNIFVIEFTEFTENMEGKLKYLDVVLWLVV